MAESEIKEDVEQVKTAADLAIEKLSARLDRLEAENRELRQANAGLYAAAQSQIVDETAEDTSKEQPKEDTAALDAFTKEIYGDDKNGK